VIRTEKNPMYICWMIDNATASAGQAQTVCNRTCLNNGVCNIVNNQQVCWCPLGYAGAFCELQG
jgi:hypothetical protein